jgi:uncharacterized repeat protein (TIGR03803 family)
MRSTTGKDEVGCCLRLSGFPTRLLVGFARRTASAGVSPAAREAFMGAMLCAHLLIAFPSAQAQTEAVLYRFQGAPDGEAPEASLIRDSRGNLYGTTFEGGTGTGCGPSGGSCGTVFEVTPDGAETVLYSFGSQFGDGGNPAAGLVMDKKGNLYGTTLYGGRGPCNCGCGTVFKLTPTGAESVLYSFGSQSGDGSYSTAGLIRDKERNLYGTTSSGGAYGNGTVFKLTPTGAETVLHSFGSSGDGVAPYAGVIMDKAGNFYGSTCCGGAHGYGAVYKLTPDGGETVLYSFASWPKDALFPKGLIMDKKGNLYGTTQLGGAYNEGTVFELTPAGTETILYSFGSHSGDGGYPYAGLVRDRRGNLYGTTAEGGWYYYYGTVFKLTTDGTETVLYSFGSQPGDGTQPVADLIMDKIGNLYGTAEFGGANGYGTVFKLVP